MNMTKFSILVVDDERTVRNTIRAILEEQAYRVETAPDGRAALKSLKNHSFDLVITDLRMGAVDGLEVLKFVKKTHPATEVIVLTAFGSVETAVEAIKAGAFDYLSKPVEPEKLLATVRNALVKSSLEGELKLLKDRLRTQYGLQNIVGKSRQTADLIALCKKIAPTESTVLITGETGVGKQLAAGAIYTLSRRADRPFVEINCAALPQEILESELFGHLKGAFTGAMEDKKGLFEAADEGTIFLDEIGATTDVTQAKLIKAIDEKTIRKVGSTETVNIDARVIACTNRDLADMVGKGEFRKDLFFRLNVVNVYIPPLRERKEDIIPLCEHFVRVYSQKIGKPVPGFSAAAVAFLNKHDWPGNVRELEHAIERAVIFCDGSTLNPRDFKFVPDKFDSGTEEISSPGNASLARMEKAHIRRVLEFCGGNRSQTARRLGIGRNTLAQKIKKYRIKLPASQ